MAKIRTITHWRHVDGDKLAQRVKSLPLGSEEETITSEIVGPDWMKRVDAATSHPKRTVDERWEEIRAEHQEEQKILNRISAEIEKRRELGRPFDV